MSKDTLSKYSVYLELPLGIRITGIEATSDNDAIDKAFEVATADCSRYNCDSRKLPVTGEDMFTGPPAIAYQELSENGLVSALVDHQGDEQYYKSTWYSPHPNKGSNDMLPMWSVDEQILSAIEQAMLALMNVPGVGDTYDQQHADTQTSAYLALKDVLQYIPNAKN